MKNDELYFELPPTLLAREPREMRGEQRSDSRLLIMDRKNNNTLHKKFSQIVEYLSVGDVLVLNNSKTIKADLIGWVDNRKRINLHIARKKSQCVWEAYSFSKQIKLNDTIIFGEGELCGRVVDIQFFPIIDIEFIDYKGDILDVLERVARPIISPYVNDFYDIEFYRNEYSEILGSTEMPAAGRHFTSDILRTLEEKGVIVCYVTLHTGLSSIEISEEYFEDHKMHLEQIEVTEHVANVINDAKLRGNKICAVGTTVVRTLESTVDAEGKVIPYKGETQLYIYPGYKFRCIDFFVTNFHGWNTSRIAMAAAFSGIDLLKKSYKEAIERGYLFYEFGDTTLTI